MINKIFSLFSIFVLFGSLFSLPVIKLDETVHDFGEIKEEVGTVSHTFFFTNSGDSDLIIEKVKPS